MNLFVETLAEYLKQEWDRIVGDGGGSREARFIVQSLAPGNSFDLFSALEEHRVRRWQKAKLECHFRIATGLWRDWLRSTTEQELDREMAGRGALGPNGERIWIDEEDRLTWYRNRTRSEGVDGLVVVLLGLNHATDQGGLADFHRVDEDRVWNSLLGRTFVPWVQRIDERLALSAGEREIEQFDAVLRQLFEVRPLRLGKLAEFLQREILAQGNDFYSMDEVIARFYRRLPFWDIPPLLNAPAGKKGASKLKEAETFISHQRFKSAAEQKKVWAKIEGALRDGSLELPETIGDVQAYTDPGEFGETLHAFIFTADTEARKRLLQTDLMGLLELLKRRESTTGKGTRKELRFAGPAFDVVLQGVWKTLEGFRAQCHGCSLAEALQGIEVEVVGFNHDLQDEDDVGRGELAGELLRACLGGLDQVFADMDLRLPRDSDEALLTYDQWSRLVPVSFKLDPEQVSFGTSRKNPYVQFKVVIESIDGDQDLSQPFRWSFGPTQAERVRFHCAKRVLERWGEQQAPNRVLPAFRIPLEVMTAVYYAADEDEANRLVGQALTNMELVNLLDGLPVEQIDPVLWALVTRLIDAYRDWLKRYVDEGYYRAGRDCFLALLNAYEELARRVLDTKLLGSAELLRRVYKAFLLVDKEKMQPNAAYLTSAIAWGISPSVLELTEARVGFLRDGFPEVVAELARDREGEAALERLLNLAEIHRPLAGLVVGADKTLSAEIKSFGLLHYLGTEPSAEKSLAVQTLLRDEQSDDDEGVADIVRPGEESAVVERVLEDYLRLYPFAEDGLRILALNVEDLGTILAGVDSFLRAYLKRGSAEWPPFHCTVTVYSASSSPMAMENRLSIWRDQLVEAYRERGRPLILSIGHRFAPGQKRMEELVGQEERLYDIAFLLHFLAADLNGETEQALPFKYDYNPANIGKFPICEYPRPIRKGEPYRRHSLLSNRRLRIQTRHADLSARLRHPQPTQDEHLVVGSIDYQPWRSVVEALHRKAQWVACVDPFVDKRLLRTGEGDEYRKIVGFSSGLGAYGELNLSISTEQDSLGRLADLVAEKLTALMPFPDRDALESLAERVVGEAEQVIGLASLRAVVGLDTHIREVLGFAAIRRALAVPVARMSQLLPVDSLQHWFKGADENQRPDLLQLSLVVRENDIPLIHALVIECKFAQYNSVHLDKAQSQVQDGLAHLTRLFAPNRNDIGRVSFDRRYWWAQLQRAMASRAVVSLPEQEWRKLDQALESLVEGYYEIAWQGAIFTFWTDREGPQPTVAPLPLPQGVIAPPFRVPDDFAMQHVALGYDGVLALFAGEPPLGQVALPEAAIRLRPDQAEQAQAVEVAAAAGKTRNAPARGDTPGFGEEEAPPVLAPEPVPRSALEPMIAPALEATSQADMTSGDERPPAPPPAPVAPPDRVSPPPEPEPPAESVVGRPVASGEEPHSVPLAKPPEKLLIGTRGNDEPVYWHYGHRQLPNRHMLIFGASGSGKTYGIQCLLAEMAGQGLHSLIVDYTDGFLPNQVEPRFQEVARPKSHFVITDKLPLNPFRRQQQVIDPSLPPIEEDPYRVATRIASIFTSVFNTMGDQQSSTLIRALEQGIEEEPGFSLDALLPRLREEGQSGESLANKLEPLIKARPFREGSDSAWEAMLTSARHWVHILQLTGMAREIQKLVTEFALWDLYDYACTTGNKNRPIPVVLDEIQNLDHRSDSPIDKMLREGRKFGLSLLLATQTTSQFTQEQRDRLFQAGHKLFFKPASTEIDRFAQLLSQTTGLGKAEWAQRLASLEKGQCWSLGPVLKSSGALEEKAVLVSVTALEKRVFGGA